MALPTLLQNYFYVVKIRKIEIKLELEPCFENVLLPAIFPTTKVRKNVKQRTKGRARNKVKGKRHLITGRLNE